MKDIPKGVTRIGKDAFYGTSITECNVPEGVTYIGVNAFGYCQQLERLSLPTTLKILDNTAFEWCNSIDTLTLPDGLESIGDKAFFGCSADNELIVPSSVKTIGSQAFYYCKSFKNVTFLGNPILGDKSFGYCPEYEDELLPEFSVSGTYGNVSRYCQTNGIEFVNTGKSLDVNLDGKVDVLDCVTLKQQILSGKTELSTLDLLTLKRYLFSLD